MDLFISYTQADKTWAEWIGLVAEDAGLTTELQARDFRPGESFTEHIHSAIERAERLVLVLSPDYFESYWAGREWQAAAARRKPLVPVRVRAVEVPGLLADQIYVDLVGLSGNDARTKLLGVLTDSGGRKPAAMPAFPGAERFPGALPLIWNVPRTEASVFAGREDELAALSARFEERRTVALTGLGGIGKSRLAAEFAFRHRADFDIVWWVVADQPATVVRDLAALTQRLGFGHYDSEPEAADAALRHLASRDRWLLIFDSAGDPDTIRHHVPAGPTGRVLITTQWAAFREIAETQRVEPLSESAGAELIAQRSGQPASAAMRALGDKLGGLPLALEQVGAFLEAGDMPAEEYLAAFEARALELLARPVAATAPTVATIWDLCLLRLTKESPAALAMLQIAAFMAPDDVPRALFQDREVLTDQLASLADPVGYSDAVAAAARYSLMTRTADGFSVHQLLQLVMREGIPESDARIWNTLALRMLIVAGRFDPTDPAAWPAMALYVPHIRQACEHARATDALGPDVTELLTAVGAYHWRRADYGEAQRVLEEAVDVATQVYGDEAREVADLLVNLAIVLQERSEFGAAESAFERAIEIITTSSGADAPALATPLRHYGHLLLQIQQYDRAEARFEEALRIDEAAHGHDDPRVATDYANLGAVRRAQNRLDDAEEAMTRALQIDLAAYGPDTPQVAARYLNLAGVRVDRGDAAGAFEAFSEVLRIDRAVYGDDHVEVAKDLQNLGVFFNRFGDQSRARAAFTHALAIFKRTYGEDHPRVAMCLGGLAVILRDDGELEDARVALERARDIEEAARGPSHPQVALQLANLATVLRDLGDIEAARATYERAAGIFSAAYGADDPRTVAVRADLEAL